MISRITAKLQDLKSVGRKAFAAYIVAGDPDLESTEKLIYTLEAAGVSIIELGVPFSDPMADGPVIQQASERALANGVTLKSIFDLVRRVRKQSQIPILLMGYYNPILQFGLEKYAIEAASTGVDGSLVVDLPVEESLPLKSELQKYGIDLIFLLTPTSHSQRIKLINKYGSGFIYYVSLTGVTGAATLNPEDVKKQIIKLKKQIKIPILVGFGISTPEHVRSVANSADGVVVGTAILKVIAATKPATLQNQVRTFTSTLVQALPASH